MQIRSGGLNATLGTHHFQKVPQESDAINVRAIATAPADADLATPFILLHWHAGQAASLQQREQSWFYGSETEFRTHLEQKAEQRRAFDQLEKPEMRLKLPLSEGTPWQWTTKKT